MSESAMAVKAYRMVAILVVAAIVLRTKKKEREIRALFSASSELKLSFFASRLCFDVLQQLALFLQRDQVIEHRILRRGIETLDRLVGAQGSGQASRLPFGLARHLGVLQDERSL